MSMLGTKNEPGSEAIRVKNLICGERAIRDDDADTLAPLVSENAVVRDPLVFIAPKEVAFQPPQMVQLISERDLSQNGSNEVDGKGFLIGICDHDLPDPKGRRIPLRDSTGALA